MSPDPTTAELVRALQQGDPDARAYLERSLDPLLTRLIDKFLTRHRLSLERETLRVRSLRWAEMYLRACDPDRLRQEQILLKELFAQVLAAAFRMLFDPAPPPPPLPPPGGLPDAPPYQACTLFRPCRHVGGDWFGGSLGRDGSFWVLVADVAGKDYPAYLVAAGLACLWRARRLAEGRARGCDPRHLLGLLAEELRSCLPRWLFVEATLARFNRGGEAVVASAGACPVLLRQPARAGVMRHVLGGTLLGLPLEPEHGQQTWQLERDDEVLLATDGVFDQPASAPDQRVGDVLAALNPGTTLHDALCRALEGALNAGAQHDDITVVTVRYCRPGTVRNQDSNHVSV
jgi:hypothetical protein